MAKYKYKQLLDGKVWMLEDLREPIKDAIWLSEFNCFLYTWEQARKAVPDGWRLPTVQDFLSLAIAYGYPDGDPYSFNYYSQAGKKLSENLNVNFTGYSESHVLYNQGAVVHWWSSSVYSGSHVYNLRLDYNKFKDSYLIKPECKNNKYLSFPVRCIKNEE